MLSTHLLTGLCLVSLGSSNILRRQDDLDTSTLPLIPTPPALTNSDAAATTTGTFSAPLPEASLDEYNDPNGCHKTINTTSPYNIFCKPVEGRELDFGEAYLVQWDVNYEPKRYVIPSGLSSGAPLPTTTLSPDDNLRLQVFRTSYLNGDAQADSSSERDKNALLTVDNVNKWNGFTTFTTDKKWLEPGSKPANLTLVLTLALHDDADDSKSGGLPRNGPTFVLLNEDGAGRSASSSSDSLGAKIGAPVAIIVILVLVGIVAFFWVKRRRGTGKPILPTFGGRFGGATNLGGKGGDYMRKRRSTGPSATGEGAGGLVGPYGGLVGRRGHTREASISVHDGPPRIWADGRGGGQGAGMELEERKSPVIGNEWGRGGSPTGPHAFNSPTQGQAAEGGNEAGGNVFRDEIGRQKTGRGY